MIKTKIYDIPCGKVTGDHLQVASAPPPSSEGVCASLVSCDGDIFDIEITEEYVIPVDYCDKYDTSHRLTHNEFIEALKNENLEGWKLRLCARAPNCGLRCRCDEYFTEDGWVWDYTIAITDLEQKGLVETRVSECLWLTDPREFRIVGYTGGTGGFRTVDSLESGTRPGITRSVHDLWLSTQLN